MLSDACDQLREHFENIILVRREAAQIVSEIVGVSYEENSDSYRKNLEKFEDLFLPNYLERGESLLKSLLQTISKYPTSKSLIDQVGEMQVVFSLLSRNKVKNASFFRRGLSQSSMN